MLHKDEIFSGTTSSGTYSQNTGKLVSCICKLILITATSDYTTFDFQITDSGDRIIYKKEGITGVLRDNPDLPMRDINTMTISTSSNDEAFSGKLSLMEVA